MALRAKNALTFLRREVTALRVFCTREIAKLPSERTTTAGVVDGEIRYGEPGAMDGFMITSKIQTAEPRTPVIFGAISWIVDELIGIRTLEQRLSRRLQSRAPQNSRILLSRIQDLNQRIDLLDRVLDEYGTTGKVA
jgi:hypothetical protein